MIANDYAEKQIHFFFWVEKQVHIDNELKLNSLHIHQIRILMLLIDVRMIWVRREDVSLWSIINVMSQMDYMF